MVGSKERAGASGSEYRSQRDVKRGATRNEVRKPRGECALWCRMGRSASCTSVEAWSNREGNSKECWRVKSKWCACGSARASLFRRGGKRFVSSFICNSSPASIPSAPLRLFPSEFQLRASETKVKVPFPCNRSNYSRHLCVGASLRSSVVLRRGVYAVLNSASAANASIKKSKVITLSLQLRPYSSENICLRA